MDAVEGKDDHHDEVRDKQADVEGVPAVVAAEGAIGVVGLPIVREAVLVGEEERESVEVMCQGYGSQKRSACFILRDEASPADVLDAQEGRIISALR
jgi:hypothetical protein